MTVVLDVEWEGSPMLHGWWASPADWEERPVRDRMMERGADPWLACEAWVGEARRRGVRPWKRVPLQRLG